MKKMKHQLIMAGMFLFAFISTSNSAGSLQKKGNKWLYSVDFNGFASMSYPSEKGFKTFEIIEVISGMGYSILKVTDSARERTSTYTDTVEFVNNTFISRISKDNPMGLFRNFQFLIPFFQPNGKKIKIFYRGDTLSGNYYKDSIFNTDLYFDEFGFVYGGDIGGNLYGIERYQSTIKLLEFNDTALQADSLLSMAISSKVKIHRKQNKTNICIIVSGKHLIIKNAGNKVKIDKIELFDCAGKKLCVFTNVEGNSMQIDKRYSKLLKIVTVTIKGQSVSSKLLNQ